MKKQFPPRLNANIIPRSRPVSSVSSLIKSTLGKYHLNAKIEEYSAFPYWREIVGDEIARVAAPERIVRRKVLAVRVLDAAWAQELSMQKADLLNKLHNAGFGAIIDDIKFLTGSAQDNKG